MIPFIDLQAQQTRIKSNIDVAMAKVLAHGNYIMGPEVAALESKLCQFTDAKHCISVSNGTDALIAALQAFEVGPGDAIVTSPFTFYATVEAIMFVGATPVFADIDPDTFNLCPKSLARVLEQTSERSDVRLRGIMPVDLFGLCCDYREINELAEQHQVFVIQDAAQAFGATFDERRAPTHATIGTTSFFPAKPLGCYGDGGAIFTDDDEIADRLRSIRVHGKGSDKYDNVRVGQNCRLDTLQAAILMEKLSIYQSELDARQRVANEYSKLFQAINDQFDEPCITIPQTPTGYVSAWAQYTIRLKDRELVSSDLKANGIPSVVYYRTPCHLLQACSSLGYQQGDLPNAEKASTEVLSLPFHPYLQSETVEQVTSVLKTCLQALASTGKQS